MVKGTGKGVFLGVAVGKIFIYKSNNEVNFKSVKDSKTEKEKYYNAKEQAKAHLLELYNKTKKDIGENEAMIIDTQILMLDDGDFIDSVVGMIDSSQCTAEYAIYETSKQFENLFLSMDDSYMQARAVDVKDVSNRMISILKGENSPLKLAEPVIIVADDLTPSQTIQFDKNKILAFVTSKGSMNSHTAILSKTMGIPSLIQADITIDEDLNNRIIAVDSTSGKYYIDPDNQILNCLTKKQKSILKQKELLNYLKGKETKTKNGKKINLYSNISNQHEVDFVLENDSQGIGLFRTEFIYMGRDTYPTEEEQFNIYKNVGKAMNGKKVIIRTLDIGADKKVDYFNIPYEENPAMGYRAIRICLDRKEVFKTQLRAIYRASIYGNLSIMFPMIISVDEVKEIKSIITEIKKDLANEKIKFCDIELGVMIETPAAVMISDILAKEVDFLSVGTNDLTQYTLAIDRQNQNLNKIYNPHHPAILKMLKIVVDSAHTNGIWAGICGELASDFNMTKTLIEMGYDELSVSPVYTLELRKIIRESDI